MPRCGWLRAPGLAIATLIVAAFAGLKAQTGAGAGKPCALLTASEIETALGQKVAALTENGPFCSGSAGPWTVMLRLARRGADPGVEAKGIEMMKQMGGKIEVKAFGPMTCSTMIPPQNMAETMGFNTTCSIQKGDSVAAVEVTAKTQKDMVPVETLRPLAEKMSSRF